MPIVIGKNIASLQAQRELSKGTDALSKIYERLASGRRINHASDDAAGLAIASSLNANVRISTQAIRNLNDGISVINIAEGAMAELKEISYRQRDLATQAANGTYSLSQRQAMNLEANALVSEYNRIIEVTKFNGVQIFAGDSSGVRIQAGQGVANSLLINFGTALSRNVGDGTYQSASSLGSDGAMDIGDVNRDGIVDIVSSISASTSLRVMIGNGNGTFKAQVAQVGGNNTMAVRLGDLNGDNILDVATANYAGSVSILIGNGDGTFKAQSLNSVGANVTSIVEGDFNGDGRRDIATAEYGGTTSILIGNGDGTFKQARSYAIGSGGYNIAIGDFNADGIQDLLSADAGANTASILLGNSDGSFQVRRVNSLSAGPVSLAVGDVTGDGILDFASASYTDGVVDFLVGNGDGTFRKSKVILSGLAGPRSLGMADLNGDGRLDLSVGDTDASVKVMLGNGDGTFRFASSKITSSFNWSLGTSDFNGDGRLDILAGGAGSSNLSILLANGGSSSSSQYLNINTRHGALEAMAVIDGNLSRIQAESSNIGSMQSRFETARSNLESLLLNETMAMSRIMDADVAQETSNLVRIGILQKGATAILEQANLQPRLALQLLSD